MIELEEKINYNEGLNAKANTFGGFEKCFAGAEARLSEEIQFKCFSRSAQCQKSTKLYGIN